MPFSLDIFKTVDLTLYVAAAAFLALCIFVVCILYLNFRIRKLLGDESAKTIEQALASMKHDISELKNFKEESVSYLRVMEERMRRSVQAVETLRFNPFKGTGDGGNQSFATAIINENGDGVILSSLYSRERISVFSKPIRAWAPQHELSEEESEALSRAKENLGKIPTKK